MGLLLAAYKNKCVLVTTVWLSVAASAEENKLPSQPTEPAEYSFDTNGSIGFTLTLKTALGKKGPMAVLNPSGARPSGRM